MDIGTKKNARLTCREKGEASLVKWENGENSSGVLAESPVGSGAGPEHELCAEPLSPAAQPSHWRPLWIKSVIGAVVLLMVSALGYLSRDESMYGRELSVASSAEGLSKEKAIVARVDQKQVEGASALFTTTSPRQQVMPAAPAPCPRGAVAAAAPPAKDRSGRIILNEASADELTELSGVGATRAAAIVALRTRLGKFKKVVDLLRVRGIGWKTLQRLRAQVVVDRPAQDSEPGSDARLPGATQEDETARPPHPQAIPLEPTKVPVESGSRPSQTKLLPRTYSPGPSMAQATAAVYR